MAEESNIRFRTEIESDALKELRLQLKDIAQQTKVVELAFKNNNITAGEARARFHELGKRTDALGVSETHLVDVKQRLWHASNRVSLGFKSLATEVIGVGKSTQIAARSMGQMANNTRAAFPTMLSMGNIIQDSSQFSFGFSAGIRSIGNNITQVAQQMPYLIGQVGSVGGAFKAMIGTLTGPVGILLAISLVTTLATVFGDDLVRAIRGAADEFKLLMSDIRAIERFLAIQEAKYGFRGKNVKEFSDKRLTSELNVRIGFIQQVEAAIAKLHAEEEKASDDRKKSIQEELKLLNGRLTLEERFLAVIISERNARAQAVLDAKEDALDSDVDAGRGGARAKETGYARRDRIRRQNEVERRSRQRRRDSAIPSSEDIPGVKKEDLTRVEQNFASMFSRVSNVFAQNMNQAWTRIFGEANSLFEQVLQSMAASISQLLGTYAVGSLLSLAPGGSVIGKIGGSLLGSIGLGGDAASVGPTSNRSIGGGGKTVIEVVGSIRGDDIRYVTDRVNRKRSASVTF